MGDNHKEHDQPTKQSIKAIVDKYGCYLASFEADSYLPAFVYSIGLFEKFNHPEICCFGLSTGVMGRLINNITDRIRKGEKIETDKPYTSLVNGYSVQFVEVKKEHYPSNFGYGGWYYDGFDFPMLQLIWPDKAHNFPWDENFNPDWIFKQPLLDRNTDFFFYEQRNLGVYTTQDVLDGAPILYVHHNEDGDWQFHSSSNPNIEEAKIVALEQLVKLDKSLNDIYYIEYGMRAYRMKKDDQWICERDNSEDDI